MGARAAASAVVGLAVACAVIQGWLLWRAGIELLSAQAVDEAFPVVTVAMVICAGMGAAIVSRLPRNRIGWLLLLQVGVGVGLVAGQLARAAFAPDSPLPRWTGAWATLFSKVFGVPWALGCLALVFLLVPDGRLWSRRWGPAVWLVAVCYALTVASLLLIGPVLGRSDPTAVVPAWILRVYDAGQIGIAVSLVPAVACLLRRARRATGNERRQLSWVLAGAAALVLGTTIYLGYSMLPGPSGAGLVWVELLFHAGYMSVPVCAGVAVLKYHLFDADRAVSRGVRLATTAVLAAAGYVVVVSVIETADGARVSRDWQGIGTSVAAFLVVVVALQPLHGWLRRLADRVVYGSRATPYDALALLIGGLPDYSSPRDLMTRVAEAAAAAVDGTATSSLLLPGGADVAVTMRTEAVPAGQPPAAVAPAYARPINYNGQTIGRLAVVPRATALSSDQRRLIAALTDEAGLAFQNARLQAELAARAAAITADTAALAESRRRLVRVGYAERDRLSATIQRDVVVHLSGLEDEVRQIRRQLPEHPDDAPKRLDRARAEVNAALDELRALTRGVYPAALARRGLTAAIRSAASDGSVKAQIETRGPVDQLSADLATTAYFATVESLRDLTGPRRAVLAVHDDRLQIEVTGEPRPQPSLATVRDRVEAVGGTMESGHNQGLRRLILTLPLDPENRPPPAAGPS